MIRFEFNGQTALLFLKTRILLALGVVLGLTLLFLFAFTFFVAALVVGIGAFLFNLFQGAKRAVPPGDAETQTQTRRYYHRGPSRDDDDVIDV